MTATTPKQVAIYARVSTEESRERHTVESQLYACRDYAARLGWQIVDEYIDEAVSGAIPLGERPAGAALLVAAKDKAFDVVVAYRFDRLGRDLLSALLAMEELKRLRVEFASVDEAFDASPSGVFAAQVAIAVGQLERSLIAARTNAGRKRHVRAGRYLSTNAPYGYRRSPDGWNLEINERQAETVRLIFNLSESGLGAKSIVKELDGRGILPPYRDGGPRAARHVYFGWAWQTILHFLHASRYAGATTYGVDPRFGPPEVMTCPAIITREQFDRVQLALRTRTRVPRNTPAFCLLRHTLRCGTCGAPYMAWVIRSKFIYACSRRRRIGPLAVDHQGAKWRWRADQIEPLVTDAVRLIYNDPRSALAPGDATPTEMDRRVLAGTLEVLATLLRLDGIPPASGSHGVTTEEADEPTPEEWRELISAVVDHVVVEPDGSLTLVGTGGGVIGRVASRTRLTAHH